MVFPQRFVLKFEMSLTVSDIKVFPSLICFASILGIFPVESLKTSKYKHSYKTIRGIWAILFFVLKFPITATVLQYTIFVMHTPIHATEIRFTELRASVMRVMFYVDLFQTYTVFFAFKIALPHFLKLYNRFVTYREKYGVSCSYTLRQIITLSTRLLLIFIESLVGVFFIIKRMEYFEWKHGSAECKFKIYGFLFPCKLLKWLNAANTVVLQFSMIYAIAFIFIFTYMVEQRLLKIQEWLSFETIKLRHTKPNLVKWGQKLCNPDIIVANSQLTDMKEILALFKKSVQLLILAFITFGTVIFTVTVYRLLSICCVGIIASPIFTVADTASLLAVILKLIWLTNCGELINNRVSYIYYIKFNIIFGAAEEYFLKILFFNNNF